VTADRASSDRANSDRANFDRANLDCDQTEGVCITCSDTAVQVRILRLLDDDMALVQAGDHAETVSVALVSAHEGDTILVHAKEAIAVVTR